MKPNRVQLLGILVFTFLFPVLASLVQYIPNPMVPGAIVSLNMILPILAGYFFGPLSGLITGSTGVLLAALFQADQFYIVGVYSMGFVGVLAGWIGGRRRLQILSAATIFIAHTMNILVLLRIRMLDIPLDRVGVTLLGLVTESVIDIIAVLLIIELLWRWLYQTERW